MTSGTLDVLGVRPVIGQGFPAAGADDDTELPVLLTYAAWQGRYGGSTSVLSLEWTAPFAAGQGRTVAARWRVVGVLPRDFLLPSSRSVRNEYDGIYGIDPHLDRQAGPSEITVAPFARLAPGVSIRAAQARISVIVASIDLYPRPRTVTVVPLQSGLSVAVRGYVWLAVGGAWVVLAATCLTLGILLLTWNHSRRHEAGLRLALGACPRQLIATALLESTCLCGAGAAVGWLAYMWARSLFVTALPLGLQSFRTETVDVRLIAMACGIALVSAIVAGTLPAIRIARVDPLDALRLQHGSTTLDRLVGGPVLLSVQAALGVMLLVGALAVVPGVLGFLLSARGFDAADLFLLHVPTASGAEATHSQEQTRRGHAVMDVVHGLPGVMGAALSRKDPFSTLPSDRRSWRRLAPHGFDGRVLAVGAGFFATLGTPMVAGRAFSNDEINRQALVAIADERGAGALWPGAPPAAVIGRTVTTGDGPRTIVGVAADMRIALGNALPGLFLPLSADEVYRREAVETSTAWNEFQVLVRMAPGRVPDRRLLTDRLRSQPWMIPNWVGLMPPEPVASIFEPALEKPRLLAAIFGTLAAIILLLTTIAVFGLASFEIRHRRDEMTVRLALGATPRILRRRFAAVTVTPVLAGVLAGLPLSWMEVTLLNLSIPLVNANDPRIYAGAAAVLFVAALLAGWRPGRRLFTMRAADLLRSS